MVSKALQKSPSAYHCSGTVDNCGQAYLQSASISKPSYATIPYRKETMCALLFLITQQLPQQIKKSYATKQQYGKDSKNKHFGLSKKNFHQWHGKRIFCVNSLLKIHYQNLLYRFYSLTPSLSYLCSIIILVLLGHHEKRNTRFLFKKINI